MSELNKKDMDNIHKCVEFYISSLNGCSIKNKENGRELYVNAVQTSRGRVLCIERETGEEFELGGFDVINNYSVIAEREK